MLLSRGEVPHEKDRGASRIFKKNPYTKRYLDPVLWGGLNFVTPGGTNSKATHIHTSTLFKDGSNITYQIEIKR